MLNYGHLRYFWAVAHEGNLTRAATRLRVSQSAVSVQIRELEAELGTPLFERRGRGLELTEAGRIALDHADTIFSVGEELESTLRERGTRTRLTLRVGALATLSRNFQQRFLEPILRRKSLHGAVHMVLRAGAFQDLVRELEAHRIDVLLANSVPSRHATTAWVPHLLDEQPVALIGPRARTRTARSWQEVLANEPLVLPSVESSIRTGLDALLYRLGIRPRIAAEVDDMAMLRLLAREGVGFAVVPPIVVRDELESGVLREVTRLADIRETFYAITLRRRFPNPLLEDLIPERTRRPGRGRRAATGSGRR